MPTSVKARQARGFIPPAFSPVTYWISQALGGVYMRRAQNIRSTQVEGMQYLCKAMRNFQEGKTRLLIMFRHVAVSDGPLIVHTVSRHLRAWCRRKHKRLSNLPHTHFLYGRGTLNWAGLPARWAFPRMGGVPVFNERVDRESQGTVRKLLVEGRFPVAFAPEGQVTYHQDRVFGLSAGAGLFPVWAIEDLNRMGMDIPVVILPVAIGYGYGGREPQLLSNAVKRIAAETRNARAAAGEDDLRPVLSATLRHIERKLDMVAGTAADLSETHLQQRIDSICAKALRLGEATAGLAPVGDRLTRVFRLRYWIMNSLFREDVQLERLTAAEREAADLRSQLAMRIKPYERVVDVLHYLRTDGISDDSPGHVTRKLECALNLLDVLQRLRGGDINTRYEPKNKEAFVFIGKSIDANSLTRDISSRRKRREQIQAAVSAGLQTAVDGLVVMRQRS